MRARFDWLWIALALAAILALAVAVVWRETARIDALLAIEAGLRLPAGGQP